MSKKNALGQGLNALLGDEFNLLEIEAAGKIEGVLNLPIDSLVPNPNQPRNRFDPDAMSELSGSIKQQGVIQPILAEKRADGTYMLIAGERRWRAGKQAGLKEIPVIIRSFSPEQKLEIALVENVQREDLTALEEAKAYYHLMNTLNLSQQDVADKVGKNRSTVANSLRLLKLPNSMKDSLEEGKLTAGHARALLSVTNPADQEQLYKKIIADELSVRDAEALAVDMNRGHQNSGRKSKDSGHVEKREREPEFANLEEHFIEVFGTKVCLKGNMAKGSMEIYWYNREDLDRIYEKVNQKQVSTVPGASSPTDP
ncbi:MAG: hypothetical protein B0D92_03240 [Spirochaeta sp. LUC14_002_19_P3]|nr:MAG: hypothetical protein B0D92_03240 [Spirochaeta sp. LUC14_002_19_P3]